MPLPNRRALKEIEIFKTGRRNLLYLNAFAMAFNSSMFLWSCYRHSLITAIVSSAIVCLNWYGIKGMGGMRNVLKKTLWDDAFEKKILSFGKKPVKIVFATIDEEIGKKIVFCRIEQVFLEEEFKMFSMNSKSGKYHISNVVFKAIDDAYLGVTSYTHKDEYYLRAFYTSPKICELRIESMELCDEKEFLIETI